MESALNVGTYLARLLLRGVVGVVHRDNGVGTSTGRVLMSLHPQNVQSVFAR
jgi:hypothetical protein